MEQMGEEVKQSGNVDKGHALSLSFYIIPPEGPVHVYDTTQERAFLFAVWTLQRVIAHSKQEPLTPGIEIKDDPVFGLMDSFMQLFVDPAVSGIKTIVSCHLEIFSGMCWMSSLIKSIAGRVLLTKELSSCLL